MKIYAFARENRGRLERFPTGDDRRRATLLGLSWSSVEYGVATGDLWRSKREGDYRRLGGARVKKLELVVYLLVVGVRLVSIRREEISEPKSSTEPDPLGIVAD